MINISMVEKEDAKQHEQGKKRFTATYGDIEIVDVIATSNKEAECKLMFMMAYELKGKTLDFEPEDIPDKK